MAGIRTENRHNARPVVLKDGEVAEAGQFAMVDSAGAWVAAVAAAGNLGIQGVFAENLTGDGVKTIIVVDCDVLCTVSSNASLPGAVNYASGPNTCDETQGTNEPKCGYWLRAESSTKHWIRVNIGATR